VARDSEGDGRRQVVRDQLEGDASMDQVKRTYRNVKTDLKKTSRGIDGTDFKDQVGNAGDEIGKDLGNLGDDVRKAGRQPEGPRDDPATTPEPTM
jgi:predicted phage gp36 major capsid-like protein